MSDKKVLGIFVSADDLLWAASKGELAKHGAITVEDALRIGPLIEIIYGSRA